jgi:hypothetical protein
MPSKYCQAGKEYRKWAVLEETVPKWSMRRKLETSLFAVRPEIIENIDL